jgi:hypothetical protein
MKKAKRKLHLKPGEIIPTITLPVGVYHHEGALYGLNLERIRSLQGKLARALQGPGGARRVADKDRCPCGKFTKWLAEKRAHRCVRTPAA